MYEIQGRYVRSGPRQKSSRLANPGRVIFHHGSSNVLHIGVEGKVLISIFDNAQPMKVKLYLQDTPHRGKKFSQVQGVVDQGSTIFLAVKIVLKEETRVSHVVSRWSLKTY